LADIDERMAHSILIFDFGTDEEAAQQAKHKIESWKQAFRLGNKISLKFERTESKSEVAESEPPAAKKSPAAKKKAAKHDKSEQSDHAAGDIKILIRLDFSDHEKLSYQRWLDRIPTEEPFKSAKSETARQGDASYAAIAERFESLD
jgi:hypothetical protein